MFDLTGKVAIVTGGNGGLGLAMAEGLAQAGAAVVLAARDAAKSKQAVDTLRARGHAAMSVAVDVTEEASCTAMVAAAAAQFGQVNILVNNAGTNLRRPPEDYTLAEWNMLLATNLTGSFACARAVLPEMTRAGGGKIINIGSMLSLFGLPWSAPYAASKGGVVQLTKALAAAWADRNIQVNAILPGWIDTKLTRGARRQMPGLEERITARTPAGRWGMPEDLAGAAVFLASRAADFITGACLPVDGGYAAMG